MNQRKLGILITYFNILLQTITGFIYVPMLLNYIGKNEYGLYQLIGSFIAYLSVMDFGMSVVVVSFYSKYKTMHDKVNMENILAIALRAYAVITIALFILGYGFYICIPDIFAKSMSMGEISSAQNLLALLLFNIVITISTMMFRAVINAYERYFFLKGLETIQLVMQPVLVVLVLQSLPSALAVAGVQTILNIILIVARIYYCFEKLHIKIRYHFWDKEMFTSFKKLSLSVFAVSIIDQVFFKTNQVILGIVSGTVAVAVYSIASTIYINYMTLSTAISGVYLPYVTELIAKNEPMSKLTDLFIRIGRLQYFLLALVASGFIIFGRQFIHLWAGESFDEAYVITILIILPFTIDLIQNIGLSILQAQNRYDFRGKVYFAMGIFNLLVAIPAGLWFGGIGCAAATGLAMFIGNGLIMNYYYWKVTGLDIIRFWKEIKKISLPIFVLAAIAYYLNMVIGYHGKVAFFFSILLYILVYMCVIYRYSINSEEKGEILSIIQKYRNI